MAPEAARAAAAAILGAVSRDTLKHLSDDPTLSLRDARTRARGELKVQGARRLTWRRYLDEHYAPWVEANRKTGVQTVKRLRVLFGELNDIPLGDISAFAVERWRSARLKAGRKPATVNRDLSSLHAAISKARHWKMLRKAHPLEDVKPAPVDRIGHVRFLSTDEEDRLLAALDERDSSRRSARDSANLWRVERGYDCWPPLGTYTDHLTPMVRLALHTGLRFGELTHLCWSDVDLVGALLTVRGETAKNARTRHVPLNDDAAAILRIWRDCTDSRQLVFPGPDAETPLTDSQDGVGIGP